MIELATDSVEPTLLQDLGATIMAHLEALIDKRVEEKVAEIMQSTATLALISNEQREIMQEMIDTHESDNDHGSYCTKGELEEIVEEAIIETDLDTAIQRAIQRTNIVEDIVDNKIDEIDWEERVRQGLREII